MSQWLAKPTIQLKMDRLTQKRATIYDQAVCELFKERSSIMDSSQEQADVLRVTEEELRFAIQEAHETRLAYEHSCQNQLLAKVMELQKENLRL